MSRALPLLLISFIWAQAGTHPAHKLHRARSVFDEQTINNSSTSDRLREGASGPAVLRAQILIDRARFSPGEIDGNFGRNLTNAVKAYQQTHDLKVTGAIDPALWKLLNADEAPAVVEYTITAQDEAGPFVEKVPSEMMEQAELKALSYTSPQEELGEKFHASPQLLAKLNPGKKFDEAGQQILVPNVILEVAPKAAAVLVERSLSGVKALDASGNAIAFFPATTGSEHDPLPVGEWKITVIKHAPIFFYNSDLFWDANEQHAKAKIAPGPNNPVGTVWIGLSKEHYGIHGTPEPASIGHSQSHGCIRLTNWDAEELSHMVSRGMTATLKE